MGFNSAFKGLISSVRMSINDELRKTQKDGVVAWRKLDFRGLLQLSEHSVNFEYSMENFIGCVYLLEILVEQVATKEIGLDLNADKTKYMVTSRDRNAGRSHSVKIDSSSIERVEEFKYLGTTITDQYSIQEEIQSRLKLGNACYHSVQNLLSSRLLSKNLKIKIYRTIILPVVLYGCET